MPDKTAGAPQTPPGSNRATCHRWPRPTGPRPRRNAFRVESHLPSTYLPVTTVEEPCKFRSSPIYATFHGSLGHIEHFGNVPVVHVLQIPQDDRLPQLGRELSQRFMDHFLRLLALNSRLGTGGRIFQLLRRREALVLASRGRVEGGGHPVVPSLTEVVHEQIARYCGNPSHERGPRGVVRAERAIHLEEYLLGQVSRLVWRTRKPVADVINPTVILLDDLLPSRSVASNTATDKGIDGLGVVQSVLPRGVTPGPIPFTARNLYEVVSQKFDCSRRVPCVRHRLESAPMRLHCSRAAASVL